MILKGEMYFWVLGGKKVFLSTWVDGKYKLRVCKCDAMCDSPVLAMIFDNNFVGPSHIDIGAIENKKWKEKG